MVFEWDNPHGYIDLIINWTRKMNPNEEIFPDNNYNSDYVGFQYEYDKLIKYRSWWWDIRYLYWWNEINHRRNLVKNIWLISDKVWEQKYQ